MAHDRKETSENQRTAVKLVVLGTNSPGGISLIARYVDDSYDSKHVGTIGVDFDEKRIENNTSLHIWDTATLPRYEGMLPSYIKSSAGILVCVDLTKNPQVAVDNVKALLEVIAKHGREDVKVTVIGTKLDEALAGTSGVAQELDPASSETSVAVQQYVEEQGKERPDMQLSYLATSAKNNFNVNEAFEDLVGKLEITPAMQTEPGAINPDDISDVQNKATPARTVNYLMLLSVALLAADVLGLVVAIAMGHAAIAILAAAGCVAGICIMASHSSEAAAHSI